MSNQACKRASGLRDFRSNRRRNEPPAKTPDPLGWGSAMTVCTLPLSTCHRWDNGNFIAVLYRRLFSSEKADIFIIEVEVDESPDGPVVIAQLFSHTREVLREVVECLLHRDALG